MTVGVPGEAGAVNGSLSLVTDGEVGEGNSVLLILKCEGVCIRKCEEGVIYSWWSYTARDMSLTGGVVGKENCLRLSVLEEEEVVRG